MWPVTAPPPASVDTRVQRSHQAGQAALRPTTSRASRSEVTRPGASSCAPPRGIAQSPPRPPMLSPSPGLVGRQHSREKRPLPVATAGAPDKGQLGTQADLGGWGKRPGSATCLAPRGTPRRLSPEPPGFQHNHPQTGLTATLFCGGQASAPLTCTASTPSPGWVLSAFPGPRSPTELWKVAGLVQAMASARHTHPLPPRGRLPSLPPAPLVSGSPHPSLFGPVHFSHLPHLEARAGP